MTLSTAPPATVGVLVALHARIDPNHLRQSLDSVMRQTRPPDEVVVVVDGPIGSSLRQVVSECLGEMRAYLPSDSCTLIELPTNVGAGPARQAGLTTMGSTYVAIQDADDVSRPERLTTSVEYLEAAALEMAGSALREIGGGPSEAPRTRRYASDDATIRRSARWNNPIGHPSFVFKRVAALHSGGYADLPGNEDYDLVARMLSAGYRAGNLQEALVDFRMAPSVFDRRGGRIVMKAEVELSRRLVSYGILGRLERWPVLLARLAYRAAPGRFKAFLYYRVVA